MKITLKFDNGCRGVYDERGVMLGYYEGRKKVLGVEDGCPKNVGIWNDIKKETRPWESIVEALKAGTYKLPEQPYLDNGMVSDEGLIKKISIK